MYCYLINHGTQGIVEEINQVKEELQLFECHIAWGTILQAKCQWTEEGEKNNPIFGAWNSITIIVINLIATFVLEIR